MNSFSNMEINDLLDNRFRLEDKHTPNYLAECFQRLFPTLGRMGLSTVIDEMARANHRAFNSSKLPIRGETLDLNFFFELWRRNFRFEGSHSDKFVFSDELRLAFRINPREFWEVLIRADRDMGTYLKDSIELLKYHTLPQAISLNLRPNGSPVDDKTIRLLREKLPFSRDNFTTHEIAKICLQLFEVFSPADYDVRRLAEELEKENGIRRLNGEFTAVLPKKALDRLSTKCVLEFFKSKPLASAEASAMERGVYTVTEADLVLINSQGSEAFWQSIIPDKSIRERTLNMWKLAGMDSDARRFAKGKQILIATEHALSDALHKHSAEMRDVYPLCQRAGVSSGDADKFMAPMFLCHDFYDLPDINIDGAFIEEMEQDDARGYWDVLHQAYTKNEIGKVHRRVQEIKEKKKEAEGLKPKEKLQFVPFPNSELRQPEPLNNDNYLPQGEQAYGELLMRTTNMDQEPSPVNSMSISEQGIDFIKKGEGFVPYAYDDADPKIIKTRITHKNLKLVKGTLTIGYGFTKSAYSSITDYLNEDTPNMPLKEADSILRKITTVVSGYIKHYWESPAVTRLQQHEFDALVSLIYNIGIGNYIKSPIYASLKAGNKEKAGTEIGSYMVEKGLKGRREKESSLFLRGKY